MFTSSVFTTEKFHAEILSNFLVISFFQRHSFVLNENNQIKCNENLGMIYQFIILSLFLHFPERIEKVLALP